MRLLIIIALCAAIAACGDHHGDSFDTLAACVADHTGEGLSEPNSLTHCLVDYPFGDGLTTEAECIDFLTDEGYEDSAAEACADFIEETGQ